MLNTPFPPWPSFTEDEANAVRDVILSNKVNYWTGTLGREFEKDYAAYTGRRHAIALHNGTAALELALYAFGIGPGDEVVTTPRTFIASASCAVMRGAKPVFADVDRDSQNITTASIEKVITKKTKAIIPVHLAGWPCAMDKIMELADKYDLVVIEDCAQAHGATYNGKPVGSFGHAAAFSFCQDKIITTGGEGGMLVLDDEEAWASAWAFKDHGKSYDAVYNRNHPPGFRWLHESFGTNWRMLEVQAVLGRMQLQKLDAWVAKRRENAAYLTERLAGHPALRIPQPDSDTGHAYYKYYAFINPDHLRDGWTRDRIMQAVNDEGVPCYSGSCSEIYLEKAFDQDNLRPHVRLGVARELGETSLMFLVHPTLGESQMNQTADAVLKVLERAAS
ncbi:MAG TPA: DegT/DnrJ/EryC1/StrS aminotransferase family protein [Gammaproteobacteria bacterium]|nr:DegT/DnrJ/EryC1/StrS aminotransferase family protein [Gammaproteobacteria bacterium]